MDYRVLGPLEVHDDDGRAIELGGRQQQLVLAMLLLHRNEVVSVDRLIDVVWGEGAPASAPKNIQVHVSRLRKALGGESGTGLVRTRANGYVLEVAPDELDAGRFQQLVEEGRQALAAGKSAEAAAMLREALALWRGEPLADFAYDSFAQGEIGRLEELRLGAVEERIDADLALGRHDDVTAELQSLVLEHPLRERFRGQLMLALYRSGRQADALRVYDEARRTFVEELGLEPGEGLQRLQRAVLADDPSLSAPERAPPRSEAERVAGPQPLRAGRRAVLLGVGGALLLAAAFAVAALAVTRDRPSAGIVSVLPNSLARIDPATDRIVAEIPVGARPASVVFADGALWVANLDDDTVQRVDPNVGRVMRTIPTGGAVSGLAGAQGAVWGVREDGIVLRIDPAFNEAAARFPTVERGSLLTGAPATPSITATANVVWAVTGGSLATPRLFRIRPQGTRAVPVVATGNGPTGIAAGFGDLWVTDSFESTVSRIDPTGVGEETIRIGQGANAVAVGEGSIWVVDSVGDKVVRIDPETNSVKATVGVGRYPTSIAIGDGAVWVGNRHDRTVTRIDPASNEVVETIPVGSSPSGLVVVDGSLWVTTQAGPSAPPGRSVATRDIARFTAREDVETDPALYPDRGISYATCAKLLNYPDAPAPEGMRLVPEVAASLPALSDDGRTYTFTIRDGFAFSPPLREHVTAQTFKHAIERSLHPKASGGYYVSGIVGQEAYASGKAARISGVVATGSRLSVTLVRPAPDFLAQIAMPFFCAVPLATPIGKAVREVPSAGPYYVAEHVPNQRIVLKRNPNYRGSRPHRLREIHYTLGVPPARSVADVRTGRADFLADGIIPEDRALDAELTTRFGPSTEAARNGRQRYFVNPWLALAFLELNRSRPLFADVRWRKAVNYAIDRRALANAGNFVSGPFPTVPTDQYLPPTLPGVGGTSLYPPSGDLRTARRLAPAGRRTAVLYACNLSFCRRHAEIIRSNLRAIGLDVVTREFGRDELFERAFTPGEPWDIFTAHWGADYADPANFLNALLGGRITDPRLARKLERVAQLSGGPRERAYAALSAELARDYAPWVAHSAGTSRDFFSARMGCQVFHPVYGMDLAALCVRRPVPG